MCEREPCPPKPDVAVFVATAGRRQNVRGVQRMSEMTGTGSVTYERAGVAPTSDVLGGLLPWIRKSLTLRRGIGAAALDIGFYANVISLGGNLGLAISTDSVGTKVLV